MTNLDRFAQGSKDPQEALPVAECSGCGGDIFPDDKVYVLGSGELLHADESCLFAYAVDTNIIFTIQAAKEALAK